MKFHRSNSSVLISVSIAIASFTGISALTFAPQLISPAIAQDAAPEVTTTSSANQISLAKHLRKSGAKLYTVFWCPHCHNQKHRFGKDAASQLDVIECDGRGVNPQAQLCAAKKIRGYPTWEINGKRYAGDRSLASLAELSKYTGKF